MSDIFIHLSRGHLHCVEVLIHNHGSRRHPRVIDAGNIATGNADLPGAKIPKAHEPARESVRYWKDSLCPFVAPVKIRASMVRVGPAPALVQSSTWWYALLTQGRPQVAPLQDFGVNCGIVRDPAS